MSAPSANGCNKIQSTSPRKEGHLFRCVCSGENLRLADTFFTQQDYGSIKEVSWEQINFIKLSWKLH